jgi:hypothetical protein
MSLLTAAAISGVRPGLSAARRSPVASPERSQSRNSPTVREAMGAKVMRVDDEAGDFVCFVGDEVLFEEVSQGQVGQGVLCGYALFGGGGGYAGEGVSAAEGRGFGHEFAEGGEGVLDGADSVAVGHVL